MKPLRDCPRVGCEVFSTSCLLTISVHSVADIHECLPASLASHTLVHVAQVVEESHEARQISHRRIWHSVVQRLLPAHHTTRTDMHTRVIYCESLRRAGIVVYNSAMRCGGQSNLPVVNCDGDILKIHGHQLLGDHFENMQNQLAELSIQKVLPIDTHHHSVTPRLTRPIRRARR